jgi:hypothetical protein
VPNIKVVTVLSVVTTVLLLIIVVSIAINPLVGVVLASILEALSLVIRAIGGEQCHEKDHSPPTSQEP